MRFLLYVSILIGASACSSAYKHAQQTSLPSDCITSLQPHFSRALYSTQVDVVGKHLSGLLIIKAMPDSSTRLLFANEAGFKFFDFGFKGKEFTVYHIIDQMNRKAVIKTLRKDFALLLMQPVVPYKSHGMLLEGENYHVFSEGKDHYYYITDADCSRIVRMERGSKRKKVSTIFSTADDRNIPDSIRIQHHNFDFTITLKRLQDVVE